VRYFLAENHDNDDGEILLFVVSDTDVPAFKRVIDGRHYAGWLVSNLREVTQNQAQVAVGLPDGAYTMDGGQNSGLRPMHLGERLEREAAAYVCSIIHHVKAYR
jgi:hypothetical protein